MIVVTFEFALRPVAERPAVQRGRRVPENEQVTPTPEKEERS